MPNTLVHLGVQAIATKAVYPRSDLKWIMVGLMIPDLPWILRRVVNAAGMAWEVYDFRAYSIVQASYVFCVILSLFFALLSARPRAVFLILSGNALLHLCLDSVEKKWGSGVLFFAPFNWDGFSLGLLWPDSYAVLLATLISVAVIAFCMFKHRGVKVPLRLLPATRLPFAVVVLTVYLVAPLLLTESVIRTDINSIATLQDAENRAGQTLLMDRERYIKGGPNDYIETFAGERLMVIGSLRAETDSVVSLQATFLDNSRVQIEQLHVFHNHWRDHVSYMGLLLIVAYWLGSLWAERRVE
jgi:hypothetical protein